MIASLLLPDEGKISVFGNDTVKDYAMIRSFTGYMPGRFSLYPDLTVEENLDFYATIFRTSVKENYPLIEPVYSFLEPFKTRLARNLSGGMKQKLALCCALIHNPRLLILDEPTTGVDAVSRKEFWDTLYTLKATGMSILVSTPYMDEAAKCDRVALIQEGKILNENTPGSILEKFTADLYEIRTSDRLQALKILRSFDAVKRAYLFGHSIHIVMKDKRQNEQWLHQQLSAYGIVDVEITVALPDFEDCFIEATMSNEQ